MSKNPSAEKVTFDPECNGSVEEGRSPADLARRATLNPMEFEKLYLQSAHYTAGDFRKRFANPTPLGLVTFCVPLTTLACFLLGLRGTSAASMPTLVGALFFVGGLGQTMVGLLEFVLGNTFPFVVFAAFAGLYLSLGYLNAPTADIASAFGGAAAANADPAYLAGVGLYLTMWTCMLGVFTIISIRTNVTFMLLFILVTCAVGILAAAYFAMADPATAHKAPHLLKSAGAMALASAMPGWYLVVVQLMAAVDFPFTLPVGDLSRRFLVKKTV